MPDAQLGPLSGLQKLASTGLNGYTLQNASSVPIISCIVPNDGNLHRFIVFAALHVTSAETGGQITVTYTLPDGTVPSHTLFAAGLGLGDAVPALPYMITVKPGTIISIQQLTALTVGASLMWVEIWGS